MKILASENEPLARSLVDRQDFQLWKNFLSADSASAVRESLLAASWTLNVNELILGRTPNALTPKLIRFYWSLKCAEGP